ncbi:hypothetical protein WAI453_008946 [Rhynchosporium graminicola]
MPPKKATNTSVYVVLVGTSIDSIHASLDSANERVAEAKGEGNDKRKIEIQDLIGGSITVDPVAEKKPAAKAKAAKEQVKEENEEEEPEAKIAAPKKTKTPAEQRAANAAKPKPAVDVLELPDNYKALLEGTGSALKGLSICVTGVPPTLGRKNAERLVVNHGGKVASSLSGKTSYVVVGNDAGPTKLEKIESLGLTTLDEAGLVKLIEDGGGKGSVDEEEEEEAEPAKSKKRKTKA